MSFPRGIFAKLVAVFLVVGLLPFLVMAVLASLQAKNHMTEAVVEFWLVRLARETAAHIDLELSSMRTSVLLWSEEEALAASAEAAASGGPSSRRAAESLAENLSRRASHLANVALAMVVARDGTILAAAAGDRASPAARLTGRTIEAVAPRLQDRAFISDAFAGRDEPLQQRDWHRSPFVAMGDAAGSPAAWQIGYAAPLRGGRPPRSAALVVLFRFDAIQRIVDDIQLRFTARGAKPVSSQRYESGYGFLFDAGADLIIAHKRRDFIGTSVTRDHKLPQLRAAILANDYGFQYYEFPEGTGKISGFAHTHGPAHGGFGWVIGVGIDNADIYSDWLALRELLAVAALIVAGFVVLVAAFLSARVTRPLTRLVGFTESVARGNLDARVSINTNDEIAVLAEAFNRMTADLKETNRRLIQAEKDAAWREMARQVAHEIKNPLTPIMLSAQQIERAIYDRHPEVDAIVKESVASIVEQCESLRDIAQNFASYAAFPKPKLARVVLEDLVDKLVSVFAAHQREGLEVTSSVQTGRVWAVRADIDAMRRVFLNLFNNSYEAMNGRGTITVTATVAHDGSGDIARISVADTGRGIAPDDLKRLFEPYFSTRSGGTGLGLAICRKIVTEHEGSINVESEPGRGTTFTITLPAIPVDAPPSAGEDASFSETRTIPRG